MKCLIDEVLACYVKDLESQTFSKERDGRKMEERRYGVLKKTLDK